MWNVIFVSMAMDRMVGEGRQCWGRGLPIADVWIIVVFNYTIASSQ